MAIPIEVLVVDDSAFMRKIIGDMLEEEKGIKVVATARDGVDALFKVEKYEPDVITLDVEMPKLNGIEFLRRLMVKNPLPVVMLSSVTTEGSKATIEALELGAFDFVTKPSGTISLDIDMVKDELIRKVKLAVKAGVKNRSGFKFGSTKARVNHNIQRSGAIKGSDDKLIVVGASTGGPRALKEVVTLLPADLNCPVLIVQHMPAGFTTSLAQRLDKLSKIQVKEAEEGDKLKNGVALLAPGDYHMLIDNKRVRLTQTDKLHNVRPAIDKTIESIAKDYGSNVIGVLLTGMGRDGAKGLKLIKEFGGKTIAQDEETSVVYGMPKVAYELGAVDTVKPVYEIAKEIINKL